MVVISVTVTESTEQIVAGIPRLVTLSTNVPAVILYTLDGSTPTLYSTQYINPIYLPTNLLTITLNILATDGVNFSPIVSETYVTNMVNDARLSHSGTTAQPGSNLPDEFPFGTLPIQPNAQFTNPADVGITVDNPALPSTPTGFDGAGNPVGFTNQPYNSSNYDITYTTTDATGLVTPGVGNLPAKITYQYPPLPPESSNQNSNMFDPRAFVIFQDASTENPEDPPYINRMSFSLENPEKARDGNYYFNSGLDAPPVNGTFLRSHYNPRTNSITYYYLDTWTNKWIISTQPYQPGPGGWDGNLGGVVLSKEAGAGFIFEWLPFTRRVLF